MSTSDLTLNAVNNVEVKQGGGKKGKKMVVVCDTALTQEQLDEYPEIELPVKQSKPNSKKDKAKQTGDGDMADFKFVVPKEDPVEEDFPLMELYEPKKEDDSRLINRGAGKKGKKKDKGLLYNPNQLPTKTVDYNKLD